MRAEIVDYHEVRDVVETALESGDLARVKDTLEPLTEQDDRTRTASQNLFVYSTLGQLYEEIQMDQEALNAYVKAYEHDNRDRSALIALSRAMFDNPEADQTLTVMTRLLVHHRYSLNAPMVARVYSTIAAHHQATGDLEKARTAYEKALEVTPGDMDLINALLGVAEESGDSEAVQAVRERLLTSLTNPESRAAVLVAIGDDYLEKLDDLPKAVEAYERALAECSTSIPALSRIADLSEQQGEWQRAVRALQTLGEVDHTAEDKVEHLDRAATIYREQMNASALAIQVYNKILDIAPTELDSFKTIARMLMDEEDWEQLEENYVRMIERQKEVRGDQNVLVVLYRNLGELRLDQLDNPEAAAEAFQAASDLVPDEMQFHETLAELYARNDETLEKAVREHREILRLAPDRLDSVDALATLYRRLERFDDSLCIFRVMDALDRADEEGKRIVERFSTHRAAEVDTVFDDEIWKEFIYPEFLVQDIAEVFALAQPALLELFAHDLEHYDLREKDARFDLESPSFFSKTYKRIVKSLGQRELPAVYIDPSLSTMRNGYLYPPAFLVGKGMLSNREEREIAFVIAKQLTLFRPEFFLTEFGGLKVLEGVLYTIFKTFKPELNVEMSKNMQRIAKHLNKKLPEAARTKLEALISRILEEGTAINLKLYIEAAEDAANRAGFIFCDDLPTVRSLLSEEEKPLGNRDVGNRFGSLLMWAISEEYMELRRRLGVDIDQ